MEVEESRGTIGFRSTGKWAAGDVTTLCQSAGSLYDVLLTVRIRGRLEQTLADEFDAYLEWYESHARDPVTHEFAHVWRRAIRHWIKGGGPGVPPPLLLPFAGWPSEPLSRIPSDKEIFENLQRYAPDADRLAVDRIRLTSPGGFSFEGLGDIVREVRELIKDLWWRNRQERARGQLEIIEKYLTIRHEHPEISIPVPTYLRRDTYLVEVVEQSAQRLRELEDRGKLKSLPRHLNYRPEGDETEEPER